MICSEKLSALGNPSLLNSDDHHNVIMIMITIRGACKTNFRPKLGFCPDGGVGGCLTQSQLFKTKTTTIQSGDFVGILSQYGGTTKKVMKKLYA